MKAGWTFRERLRPREVPGLMRLGNPHGDGGYVVPQWVVESTDLLLSLGIGHDWSFEEDVLRTRPGVSIIGVDHTLHASSIRWSLKQAQVKHALNRILRRSAKASKYAARIERYRRYERIFSSPHRHMEKAVSSVRSPATVTVDELFSHIDPGRPHRVLVSMDIEGSEYEVVGDLLEREAAINMIVAEFHHIGRHEDEFERSIAAIQRSFEIVHLHGNNCAPYNHDLDIPEVIEITFVHRSLMPPDSLYSALERPIPGLDVANRPDSPDYELEF